MERQRNRSPARGGRRLNGDEMKILMAVKRMVDFNGIADYGLQADLFTAVPELVRQLEETR